MTKATLKHSSLNTIRQATARFTEECSDVNFWKQKHSPTGGDDVGFEVELWRMSAYDSCCIHGRLWCGPELNFTEKGEDLGTMRTEYNEFSNCC